MKPMIFVPKEKLFDVHRKIGHEYEVRCYFGTKGKDGWELVERWWHQDGCSSEIRISEGGRE